jgi:hypothetical protein
MPQTPLEITAFDGGMTDNFLGCQPNQYQRADNLLVRNNKKFETRFGTRIYDASMYQLPSGNQRVGSFVLFDSQFFMQSARALYYQNVTWQTVTGPSGNPFLPANSTSQFMSQGDWNGHLLAVSDSFCTPQKLYKDQNAAWQVRTAGLPSVTLVACMELANELKSKFNLHIASGVIHVTPDAAHQISSANAHDFASLLTLTAELMTDYTAHNADANLASAWVYHAAQQTGTKLLGSTTVPITLSEAKAMLDDIKAKYNSHDADATAHNLGSSQQSTKVSLPTIASAGGTGSDYIYALVPYYSYFVGSNFFEDFGPTVEIPISNVGVPESNTITISNIPTIANGSFQNYDTSNIKWKIYRTKDGGTTRLYVKEITNGTTSTTDTTADASLNDLVQIYTSGGVLDNDPPPPAKFVTIANDIAWYAHVREGGQTKKSRIRQSVKFDIDSCPEGLFIDLEDEIIGFSSVNIYPVAFGATGRIFRLEGFKDELGTGVIEKREIAKNVVLTSNNSIVQTVDGIYFAATTGFYFTDGSRVIKISDAFNDTYASLVETSTQRSRIYGKYDALKNRIFWAVTEDSASNDNDTLFVLDLKWGLRPSGQGIVDTADSTFTTLVPSSTSWSPCCVGLDASGNFVIGDRRGYIFKMDSNKFSDPRINTGTTPSNWFESSIVWNYEGPGINAGTDNLKKQVSTITAVMENQSNVSLQISAMADNSGVFRDLAEVRRRGNVVWGDIDAPNWLPGSDTPFVWLNFPLIIEQRRLPANPMRFLYLQIKMTNSNTVIIRSDDFGLANVNNVTHKAALEDYPTMEWPADLTDYFITFAADGYVKEYPITSWTDEEVTFTDNANTAPSGEEQAWVIRGIRKNERLNLVSYSFMWELLSDSHRRYRGEDGGNEA